jgi:hypothetical protein
MRPLGRQPCPLCTVATGVHHCKAIECDWYVCYSCTETKLGSVFFDSRTTRYFIEERRTV